MNGVGLGRELLAGVETLAKPEELPGLHGTGVMMKKASPPAQRTQIHIQSRTGNSSQHHAGGSSTLRPTARTPTLAPGVPQPRRAAARWPPLRHLPPEGHDREARAVRMDAVGLPGTGPLPADGDAEMLVTTPNRRAIPMATAGCRHRRPHQCRRPAS